VKLNANSNLNYNTMPENENIENQEATNEVVVWKTVEETNENSQPTVGTFKIVDENAPKVEPIAEEAKVEEVVVDEAKTDEIAKEEEKVIEEEAQVEVTTEIDEAKVLEFLKTQKGFEANSLDDLKPKEQKKLNAVVEKFQQFVDETNNDNFDDFRATQIDWSKEDANEVLRHVIKIENPTLTDDEREYLFKKKYSVEGLDEQYESDKDIIVEKGINAKVDYQKGLALLESQKEKYKVVRGADENIPEDYKLAKKTIDDWQIQQEENKKFIEQNVADFKAKTESVFSDTFEGFKVKVGEAEFKVKPEDVKIAKETLSDLSNFDKKFFDEKQQLKDPQEYYKALYFAMNPDKVAEHFINIGKTLQAEADELESKNVTVAGTKNIQNNLNPNALPWKVVDEK